MPCIYFHARRLHAQRRLRPTAVNISHSSVRCAMRARTTAKLDRMKRNRRTGTRLETNDTERAERDWQSKTGETGWAKRDADQTDRNARNKTSKLGHAENIRKPPKKTSTVAKAITITVAYLRKALQWREPMSQACSGHHVLGKDAVRLFNTGGKEKVRACPLGQTTSAIGGTNSLLTRQIHSGGGKPQVG